MNIDNDTSAPPRVSWQKLLIDILKRNRLLSEEDKQLHSLYITEIAPELFISLREARTQMSINDDITTPMLPNDPPSEPQIECVKLVVCNMCGITYSGGECPKVEHGKKYLSK